MPVTQIYGPQNFTTGDFTTASYAGDVFESSDFGGGDTPITGYGEFGYLEDVKRVLGTGPNGENVVDTRGAYGPPASNDYAVSQVTAFAVGDRPDGQYDCRGAGTGIRARCWAKLLVDMMVDVGYAEPMNLFGGGPTGTDPGYNNTVFAGVWMSSAGTAAFNWGVRYRKVNGTVSGASGSFTGPSDMADDAWHKIELRVKPATVTGAFSGTGFVGSASVATDGEIRVFVDDVEIITLTGLQNTVNYLATSNPDVYYGFGYKHGDWDN